MTLTPLQAAAQSNDTVRAALAHVDGEYTGTTYDYALHYLNWRLGFYPGVTVAENLPNRSDYGVSVETADQIAFEVERILTD